MENPRRSDLADSDSTVCLPSSKAPFALTTSKEAIESVCCFLGHRLRQFYGPMEGIVAGVVHRKLLLHFGSRSRRRWSFRWAGRCGHAVNTEHRLRAIRIV